MRSSDNRGSLVIAGIMTLAMLGLVSCNSNGDGDGKKGKPMQPVQTGAHDTPITVGGGAATFYLNEMDKNKRYKDWYPAAGVETKSYCAVVSDASQIVLDGFEANGASAPVLTPGNSWELQLQTAGGIILMKAGTDLCSNEKGTSVQISVGVVGPAGRTTGFYKRELPGKRHNRRFKNAPLVTPAGTCNDDDEDANERITAAIYNQQTFTCDDQNCRIFIGAPMRGSAPTPTGIPRK